MKLKKLINSTAILLMLTLAAYAGIGDQDGHSGDTLVIDNVYSNHGGSHFYVGSSGADNTLIVTNGGMLGGVDRFFLGEQAGASNNLVQVTGAGSSITNSGIFFLGQYDGGNTLAIEDGGRVYSANRVLIGHRDGDANRAVIDNGRWVQGRLELGNAWSAGEISHQNSMVITNGGEVLTGFTGGGSGREGYAYIGRNHESTGNTVVVTGEGSYWGLTNWLEVGQSGSAHNRLIIERGAAVSNVNYAYIGAGNSTNNSVLVTGAGSRWHVDGTNYASRIGTGSASLENSLTVTDEGLAVMDGGLTIGGSGTALSNRVTVSDGGRLEVNDDSLRMYGTEGALRITGGGEVAVSIADGDATYALDPRGNNNLILVDGEGSLLELDRHIWDNSGTGNMLVITNGGLVRYTQPQRALVLSSSKDFLMHVSGTDSHYDGNHILMGRGSAHDNEVRIDDGGRASVTYLYLNEASTSSNNTVTVTGEGSLLESSHSNGIRVGNEGSGAAMTVENGAAVESVNAYVGHGAGSTGNLAVITGAGTTWTNTGTFHVGYGGGAGNRLLVADDGFLDSAVDIGGGGALELDGGIVSGRVDIAGGGILEGAGTVDGAVETYGLLQSGAGAGALNIAGDLTLRDGAEITTQVVGGNRLLMSGTAGHTATIGAGADVTLTDNDIRISDSGNELHIVDGGKVSVTHTDASQLSMSGSENRLLITGAGSEVALERHIYMGGADNSIVVTNGGALELFALVQSSSSNNFGNLVQVSGAGTTYDGGHLLIGREGYDNQVLIDDGATAQATYAYVSERAVASNNLLRVTGGASLELTDGIGLHVGSEGSLAEATVDAGGTLRTTAAYIGYGAGSTDNLMTVTGMGSAWTNTGTIYVGYGGGQNNRLELREDAEIESSDMVIGDGGTLLLDSGFLDSFLTIEDGGALEGEGIIFGSVDSGGRIAPGQSAGDLDIQGNLTLQETSLLDMEIGGTDAGEYDRLLGFGLTIAFDGTLSVTLIGGYDPQDGDTFTLFDGWDLANSSGSFADYDLPDLGPGLGWDSSDLESEGTLTVIPEPATGLLLAAILGLAALRRRRG